MSITGEAFDDVCRNEFGFLNKKCNKIRPGTISLIPFVSEYVDVLRYARDNGALLNDETVFRILQRTYKDMLENEKSYRTARNVINKISKDIYGDPHAWQYK